VHFKPRGLAARFFLGTRISVWGWLCGVPPAADRRRERLSGLRLHCSRDRSVACVPVCI